MRLSHEGSDVAGGSGLVSPDCPMCGNPPIIVLGAEFAMCGEEKCRTVSWNPSRTIAHNMSNVNEIEFPSPDNPQE